MSAKSTNLEAIKLCKEKHNLPLVNQASSLHHRVMKLRYEFPHQFVTSKQEGVFHLQCTIPEAAPPKVLWVNEVEVEPALPTTDSNAVNRL